MVITIKYWPILARASGLFRMCVEAGVEFQHVTDPKSFGAAFIGDLSGTNLAPPILVDGDLVISQASACHSYLGHKLGFTKGIPVNELAIQFVSDLSDLHQDMWTANDSGKLHAYLTGDRYKSHLGVIERSIKGPYYFGDTPTYVDFATTSYFDMCEHKWLNPLREKSGDTLAACPKLKAVLSSIRSLPSAAKLAHVNPVPPHFVLTPEQVADIWP